MFLGFLGDETHWEQNYIGLAIFSRYRNSYILIRESNELHSLIEGSENGDNVINLCEFDILFIKSD